MDSSWFLERLDTSKLSLCVIRHVRRTAGGHGVRWLATISHTALVVLILSCSPSLSHLPFVPLYLSSAASRSLQPTSSASISPGYAFHMAFGWLLPFSRFLSIFLSLLIRRPSLYLSIVHNYTIRLLNRLMRPLLPALAAPFTETTTDEHESMSLSLSIPSSPLLFHRPSLSLFLSFHFAFSRKTLTGYVTPCFSVPAIYVSPVLLPVNPLVSSRSLFFPVCVYAPRVVTHGDARCSFLSFLSGVNTVSLFIFYLSLYVPFHFHIARFKLIFRLFSSYLLFLILKSKLNSLFIIT